MVDKPLIRPYLWGGVREPGGRVVDQSWSNHRAPAKVMAQRAMDAVEWDHGDGGDVLEVVGYDYLKGIENMAGWNIQDELFFSSSVIIY